MLMSNVTYQKLTVGLTVQTCCCTSDHFKDDSMRFNAHINLLLYYYTSLIGILSYNRGRRGRDHMVFGFTTTYAISAYHQ